MTAVTPIICSTSPDQEKGIEEYFESCWGLDHGIIFKIMATALNRGGDYCDLFFQHRTAESMVMEEGRVNQAYTSTKVGLGVRVINGEKVGFASTQILDLPSMLEAAGSAAMLACPGGGEALPVRSLPDCLRREANIFPWRDQPPGSTRHRIELLRRAEKLMTGSDPAVTKTILHLSDSESRIMLATSEGVLRSELRPAVVFKAVCAAEKAGRRESNSAQIAARAGRDYLTTARIEATAREAAASTMLLFEARPMSGGEMPCVLAAGSAGILLHEAVGHGLEADFSRRGLSAYSGRLGERVASGLVTIVDDGTVPQDRGSINFDDEGNGTQRTVLVENGRLRSYLHDRLTSAHFKTPSTGSGRRQSFEHPPMPRMRSTYMEAGPHSPEEITASVKRGLYAEKFTNGQVDIASGNFTFYVKNGWAIENGRLTHPVKDVNIIGNGPEILSRITMVGDNLSLDQSGGTCGKKGQSVPVGYGLPTVLVSSINVGGGSV